MPARVMLKSDAAALRDRLVAEIQARGVEREELATALGVAVVTITNCLSPVGAINRRGYLLRIARYLGMTEAGG